MGKTDSDDELEFLRSRIIGEARAAKIDDPAAIAKLVIRLKWYFFATSPEADHKAFNTLTQFLSQLHNLGNETTPPWMKASRQGKSFFDWSVIASAAAAATALNDYCGERDSYERVKTVLLSAGIRTEHSLENWAKKNRKKNDFADTCYIAQLDELVYKSSLQAPMRRTRPVEEIKSRSEDLLSHLQSGFVGALPEDWPIDMDQELNHLHQHMEYSEFYRDQKSRV